ncbi:hypothetical protein MGMO_93c00560 [Methyloglobulus morosus KoM1]|uniref:DUF1173 domain-containing protein n=1 Tax=Methyloglobulus morosus KoM1 TaxID=1116472 RepID=V5C4M6_9GAMM|nr:DUF1173 domain-containing protein [Methyloglobulus morosus]ESS71698.1 hypothetical protein MGMO_93c00560 [Methyloglobulus morosus KoM1]
MSAHYIVQGEKIEANGEGLQASLRRAYPKKIRPLCPCKQPPVEMYIAKVNDQFIVKRMPNTGSDHDLECGSYEVPPGLSGLGQVLGSAIKENSGDGLTALKFGFSLSKGPTKTIPTGNGEEMNSVKTDGNKLSLRGTLHYLWEQAGFNKWSPGMAGKRNWFVIRKYLYEAAKDKTAKNISLDKLVYIPEAFKLDQKDELTQRRLASIHSLRNGDNKHKQLMLMVGEGKEITAARFGYKMVVKHLPDFPIMLNDDIYHRLLKRFNVEIEIWSANVNGHLMVIGTFGINDSGIPSFEEIALMTVTEHWIPYDNADELRLINTLTQANQCFIKCLRYNLPSTVPTASLLLADKDKMTTALFICQSTASETYRNDLNALIESSEIKTCVWDVGYEVLPKFPFQVSEDLK